MFNVDLKKEVITTFNELINKYNFIISEVNENEVMLIGNRFAISIGISLDGIGLKYIYKNQFGKYIGYYFSNYISSRFDKNDSACYGNPKNNQERIISSLQVKCSGLKRHWENILEGDQSWIDDYIKTDGDDNLSPHESEIAILKKYF